jgi:hypothetical protein
MWSRDLSIPDEPLPPWMLELAEKVKLIEPGTLLPTGVIVGSAVVVRCMPLPASSAHSRPYFQWRLTDIRRARKLRNPTRRPKPV